MIIAPKDHLILSCDLSQAESWVVAYLANDANMKDVLLRGVLHETTARGIYNLTPDSIPSKEQRYGGKKTNHSTAYRISAERAAEEYNLESPDGSTISVRQARQFQTVWHELYPRIRGWWFDIDYTLAANHNTMVTPYGFPCTFYGILDSAMKKQATAFVPQSTVADHFNGKIQKGNEIPGGLLEFDRVAPKEVSIVNQSHDSFLAYVPKSIVMDVYHLAKKVFYRPVIIKGEECWIPVDGEIGERWGELEKIKEVL